MNYTDLKTNIEDICEQTFTTAQLDMFIQQAEQKIYESVDIPALRKNSAGTVTSGNRFLSAPTDFLYPNSLSVTDGSGNVTFLLNKDSNFIREAYPNVSTTSAPLFYALYNSNTFLLAPTPDSNYTVELHYGSYPESIVTASTTWLGNNFDSALLNGSLLEAIRFMKGETDMVDMYSKMYLQSLQLLKNLGDGKLRQDKYRSGQLRAPVG
tara:strand:- start:4166 stop:4795 length:630 start_codon:yes stop_codon:yes gene_type:complete